MRKAELSRKTNETDIDLMLSLDGNGLYQNDSGCGFLDHMLDLFARHGRFDLAVRCEGDSRVDFHHSVEDIGILLGKAFTKALGDGKGIVRYGSFILPMDEALILCAVDISGRSSLYYDVNIPAERVGEFDTELVEEFMLGFSRNFGATIHIKKLAGENSHHTIEAVFKCLARALAQAVRIDAQHSDDIPSTKGVLL